MGKRARRLRRNLIFAAAVPVLAAMLVGCTGRGGGYLAPVAPVFTGAASFGFSFSCERSSASTSSNPPAGRLHIELSYDDHGTNPLGDGFSVHGIVDTLDPVLESEICIGQDPPPTSNELIFLGTYRPSGAAPAGLPKSCATSTSVCRFEVVVRDNDLSRGPSKGDAFSIRLSGSTAVSSQLDPATVFYVRAGLLEGGNLSID
jgi:hypothetical protein